MQYIDYNDLLEQKGYKTSFDRGLSVNSIRKNSRETILSVSSAPKYEMSWLAKALNKALGIRGDNKKNA